MPLSSNSYRVKFATITDYRFKFVRLLFVRVHYIISYITGSHTEFFDKFNIRASLATIFKAIWHYHPALKHRMIEFARLVFF